ncbi:Trm112 family protein [Solilutibacter silvestris]|uniref:Trm112p-like protein n=1 Tax=Solilutibacter silvestris TaxID=1645665 RepID=A0A2K1Q362_9GAMM|nr:Trm112 family protein [Lysobacter silvestris]PNS09453.1 Trm112p-like protein [Lysobacter silvestris]
MDKKLLDILACPVTRQPLTLLDGERLKALNAIIGQSGAQFGEHRQTDALREALVTRDGKRIYRIDDGIPVLLPDEALDAGSLAGPPQG